jgi:hypothetical protein
MYLPSRVSALPYIGPPVYLSSRASVLPCICPPMHLPSHTSALPCICPLMHNHSVRVVWKEIRVVFHKIVYYNPTLKIILN